MELNSKKIFNFIILMIFYIGTTAFGSEKKDSGKLEIMVSGGGYYTKYFQDTVIPEFNKAYPNIEITVVDDSNNQIETRLAAGNPPDIYTANSGPTVLKYAKADKLVNLIKLDGYKEIASKVDKDYFTQVSDGESYGIPWLVTTTMMIYNKELFKIAGLDPNRPPKTFDEVLEYAKKIYSLPNIGDQKVYGADMWNDALVWGGWYWEMLAPVYYTMNQGKYTLLNKSGTDIAFDKPESKMTEFLNFFRKLQEYMPVSVAGNKDFFQRATGIRLQFGYGWKNNFNNARDKPMVIGKDVGVAPIPVLKKGDTSYSLRGGRDLIIFRSNSEKEKNAWILIKFLMNNDKIYIEACKQLGWLPTMHHVEKKDSYFSQSDVKPFIDQLKTSLPCDMESVAYDIQNLLLQAYSDAVVTKKVTAEEAIKTAAEKSRELLKKQ